MKNPLGQRTAFAVAILCYAVAVASTFAAFLYQSTLSGDPVRALLIAAVVFFVGCGVVLRIIGTARLKGVLSGSADIGDRRFSATAAFASFVVDHRNPSGHRNVPSMACNSLRAAWKAAYDAFDAERKTMGVTGDGVYRSVDNSSDVAHRPAECEDGSINPDASGRGRSGDI